MDQSSPPPLSRQQRRALARAQKKGQDTPNARTLTDQQLAWIGEKADQIADHVVREQLGIRPAQPAASIGLIVDDLDGTRVLPLVAAKGGLIAVAARHILRRSQFDSSLVAGRAIWSVGCGDEDTFDHGFVSTGSIALDVEMGRWHLWLELGGWLLDFSTRLLPEKLKAEHSARRFSTPPHRWNRFPDVLTHDLARPMPDPYGSRFDRYGYQKEHPEMLRLVLDQIRTQHQRVMELVDKAFDEEGFCI